MTDSRINKIRRALGGQTSLEGALDAMAHESEDKVLERVSEFSDLVVTTVEKLGDLVRHFSAQKDHEFAQAAAEIDRLESEADDRKREIGDALAKGGVFFIGRADLARLVSSMDDVANYCAGAADRIAMRPLEVSPEFGGLMVQMVEADLEAVYRLRDAIGAMQHDFRDALTIAGEVDKIETRADDLFASMYRLMFDMDIDYKTFHQLKSIIERLESIADKCAHNAELIRHMVLEYLESA
jgi:predicted phosphate transport protein (TIGR00153 family)